MWAVKLLLVALCGVCWRLGGKQGYSKVWRRFVCPLLIIFPMLFGKDIIRFSLSYGLLCLSFSVGYGDSSKLIKWFKNKYIVRCICGLLYSFASVILLYSTPWLLCFHVFVSSIGVTLAGNQKFKLPDNEEEAFIGALIGFSPIMGGI